MCTQVDSLLWMHESGAQHCLEHLHKSCSNLYFVFVSVRIQRDKFTERSRKQTRILWFSKDSIYKFSFEYFRKCSKCVQIKILWKKAPLPLEPIYQSACQCVQATPLVNAVLLAHSNMKVFLRVSGRIASFILYLLPKKIENGQKGKKREII